jgi:hypothetical protein
MARIEINSAGDGAYQLLINGIDYSTEVFRGAEGVQLVTVGDDPDYAEIGLRVTFAVSRLSIDNETDVELTDHVREAAAKVRSAAARRETKGAQA